MYIKILTFFVRIWVLTAQLFNHKEAQSLAQRNTEKIYKVVITLFIKKLCVTLYITLSNSVVKQMANSKSCFNYFAIHHFTTTAVISIILVNR